VFDDRGRPVQYRGVTQVPELYFLGLHWMHTFKSGLFSGVGSDAEYLAEHMGLMTGRGYAGDGAAPLVVPASISAAAFHSTGQPERRPRAVVRRATAFAGFASVSQRGHQTTGTDEVERSVVTRDALLHCHGGAVAE
jgi:hypothetical protein